MNFMCKQFSLAERITFLYAFLTGCYILLFYNSIPSSLLLLSYRMLFTGIIFVISICDEYSNWEVVKLLRYIFPLALTAYWYPETFYLNNNVLVTNLDGWFDQLDIHLFSCSPALVFSTIWPQAWISELMYFGYFAYYLLFAFIALYFYLKLRDKAEDVVSPILASFLLFYLIFIFLPVAGPQFYYNEINSQVPSGYLFSNLMRGIQDMGENPTGAFPSSHVGMTLIYMYIVYRHVRTWFWIFLPVCIVLIASTVYIKAHYLIDVLGAFLLTPPIYWLGCKLSVALKNKTIRI